MWTPRVGGPKFRVVFLSLAAKYRSSFLVSWNCGRVSRPRSTQTARLGFSDINLCEPRRPTGRSSLLLLTLFRLWCFSLSWRPLGPSSTRALQLGICRKEVSAKLRPPRHSRWLAKGALQLLRLSHRHHCCFVPATRSPWQVHGGGISFNATGLFPFLWLWHCVVVALASLWSPPRIVASPEAGTSCTKPCLATCPPSLFTVHAILCEAWWKKNSTLLCGSSFMHNGCACATRCVSLVV